jgi:hypothetical protein
MKPITTPVLIVFGAILLAILSACGAAPATDKNQNVAEIASKIADFDVPAGYAPELSAHLLGYSLASYKGTTGPSHLYLVQSEKDSDKAELQKMLEQMAPGSSNPNTRMTVVENRTATVRGQEADVVISEGTNSDNVTYRQATVAFQGKGGPALLVFSESADLWDQAVLDTFLGSIQ